MSKQTFLWVIVLLSPCCLFSSSLLDHYDQLGSQAFTDGKLNRARNHWIQYSELCRRICDQDQMKRYIVIQQKLETIPPPELQAQHDPENEVIKIPPKKKTKRKVVYFPQKNHNQKYSTQELKRRAKEAEISGRLERALFLYKMLLKRDPGNHQAETKIKKIINQMN